MANLSATVERNQAQRAQSAKISKLFGDLTNQSLILGALLVLLVLTLIPIVLMLVFSFKDNGQIYGRFWLYHPERVDSTVVPGLGPRVEEHADETRHAA